MPDPLFQLAAETEGALDAGGSSPKGAGNTLLWAAFNLRTARIGRRIVDQLGSGAAGYTHLRTVLPEEWDVLEIAAMSLGFEDAATALDLCANVVFLAAGGTPNSAGKFKDVGFWAISPASPSLPAATGLWVSTLLADPDTGLMKRVRDALTHRYVSRAIKIGGGTSRSLAEIAEPGGVSLGSIGVLIPRLVEYAEEQYQRCCAALQTDFGP